MQTPRPIGGPADLAAPDGDPTQDGAMLRQSPQVRKQNRPRVSGRRCITPPVPPLHEVFGQICRAFEQPGEPSVGRARLKASWGRGGSPRAEARLGAALLAASSPQLGVELLTASRRMLFESIFLCGLAIAINYPPTVMAPGGWRRGSWTTSAAE